MAPLFSPVNFSILAMLLLGIFILRTSIQVSPSVKGACILAVVKQCIWVKSPYQTTTGLKSTYGRPFQYLLQPLCHQMKTHRPRATNNSDLKGQITSPLQHYDQMKKHCRLAVNISDLLPNERQITGLKPLTYDKVPYHTRARVPYMSTKSLRSIQGRPLCRKYQLWVQITSNKTLLFILKDNVHIQSDWPHWGPAPEPLHKANPTTKDLTLTKTSQIKQLTTDTNYRDRIMSAICTDRTNRRRLGSRRNKTWKTASYRSDKLPHHTANKTISRRSLIWVHKNRAKTINFSSKMLCTRSYCLSHSGPTMG
jgi:hypothetical protein